LIACSSILRISFPLEDVFISCKYDVGILNYLENKEEIGVN